MNISQFIEMLEKLPSDPEFELASLIHALQNIQGKKAFDDDLSLIEAVFKDK